MDEFSYLSVLLSIILGLAVTEILTGFRGLLQARGRVRLYWPSLVWAFAFLLIYAQSWWAMFGLRTYHDWSFAGFSIVLLHMLLFYMIAGIIFPEMSPGEPIDLRENYFAQRIWFCALSLLAIAVSLAKDLILNGTWTNESNLVFHGIFAAGAIAGLCTQREIFHKIFAVGMAGIFLLYIGLLFAHLH